MRLKGFHLSLVLVVLAAVAIAPAACKRDRSEDQAGVPAQKERVFVRFVNATAHPEPVALYLDKVAVASDVAPDKVTPFMETDARRHVVEVRSNDPKHPAATNSENFAAGEYYTVVGYSNKEGAPEVAIFEEKRTEPATGKARIHVIHMAPGVEDLDVYSAGSKDALAESIDFNTSSYVEVDPTVRSIEIKREGEGVVSLLIDNLTLTPGDTHTIIVEADKNNMLHAIQAQGPAAAASPEGRAKPYGR
jgi:hypothetical protein